MRTSETLIRDGLYPAATSERKPKGCIGFKWSGEKRSPRKGEWYLSGAIIEAYRAPNDLSTAYHIATPISNQP